MAYDPLAGLSPSARARLEGLPVFGGTSLKKPDNPLLSALGGPGDPRADLGEVAYGADSMSEEDLASLAGLGALGEDMTENSRQMALAEGLRDRPAPEGREAGRAYVAANPLEHLSAGIDKYRAIKDLKNLKGERKGIQEKQTAGRGKYWDLLRGKKQKDQKIDIKMPKLDL